ncbi:hypothetical protein BMS3Abin07_00854 [bacterium BMS3Abin07]|nr:hypothetical protein BMS3Abin07_00854 [bacterium BMS3Abin07]GBE33045.1 hypothetical protein BMS3Bbin05_01977 [bacterium BMS3Bbin05]
MYFLPVSLALFLLFLVLVPILFVLAPAVVFAKLGLNPILGYAFFLFCLLGGGINIPVHRETVSYRFVQDDFTVLFRKLFGIRVPAFRERILAVNLGGAILPGVLSLYLLTMTPFKETFLATVVTSAVSFILSKPVKGVGIVMPAFVPPIVAAITAIIIAREHAPQVAYISGVMGVLIGADLVRLPQMRKLEANFLSIGGAGVFDGIYLVGLVSVLLA